MAPAATFTSTKAPRMPPSEPAMQRMIRMRRSTLPWRMCDVPEAAVVNSFAACTLAEVCAGGTPEASSTVDEITP